MNTHPYYTAFVPDFRHLGVLVSVEYKISLLIKQIIVVTRICPQADICEKLVGAHEFWKILEHE